MRIKLIKPYSIWIRTLTQEAQNERAIAIFTYMSGMWKEFNGAIFGIGDGAMNFLLNAGYAEKI